MKIKNLHQTSEDPILDLRDYLEKKQASAERGWGTNQQSPLKTVLADRRSGMPTKEATDKYKPLKK